MCRGAVILRFLMFDIINVNLFEHIERRQECAFVH